MPASEVKKTFIEYEKRFQRAARFASFPCGSYTRRKAFSKKLTVEVLFMPSQWTSR